MLKHALRDAFALNLAGSHARAAAPCIIAIALALLAGSLAGRPVFGLVAAGGAMSVGFGAFQVLGNSRTSPMVWASAGMALSAAIGSLIPHTPAGLALNGVVVGLCYGMATALGPGITWIALQCAIIALVATAYPTGLANAAGRGLLILLGGLAQTAFVLLFRRLHTHFRPAPGYEDSFRGIPAALQTVLGHVAGRELSFRYALKLAVTLAIAALAARLLGLSNGYWVPMTALLVLRTDLRETYSRGLARVAGTVVGAGLATLLASTLRPGPFALSGLVVLFAWLCYSVVAVNYGVFSVCVTAYIAFLLSFAGLPESETALHRVANTALGGALALLAATPLLRQARRQRELHHGEPPNIPGGDGSLPPRRSAS